MNKKTDPSYLYIMESEKKIAELAWLLLFLSAELQSFVKIDCSTALAAPGIPSEVRHCLQWQLGCSGNPETKVSFSLVCSNSIRTFFKGRQ